MWVLINPWCSSDDSCNTILRQPINRVMSPMKFENSTTTTSRLFRILRAFTFSRFLLPCCLLPLSFLNYATRMTTHSNLHAPRNSIQRDLHSNMSIFFIRLSTQTILKLLFQPCSPVYFLLLLSVLPLLSLLHQGTMCLSDEPVKVPMVAWSLRYWMATLRHSF